MILTEKNLSAQIKPCFTATLPITDPTQIYLRSKPGFGGEMVANNCLSHDRECTLGINANYARKAKAAVN